MQYLVSEEAKEDAADIQGENKSLGQSNTRTTRKSLLALSASRSMIGKSKLDVTQESSSDCFADVDDSEEEVDDDHKKAVVNWDDEPGSKKKSHTSDGPKTITVKHYLVNLESISYINRIKYI